MRLTIEITMEGAAFEDRGPAELKQALDNVFLDFTYPRNIAEPFGILRDSNGQRCGRWSVSDE